MAFHKLHGEWTSYVVADEGGGILRRKDDGKLYLRIPNPQGDLERGSNHNGEPLEGNIQDLGNGNYALHLTQQLPARRVRHYEGAFIGEIPVGGVFLHCAGSVINLDFQAANEEAGKPEHSKSAKDKARGATVAGQDEGTWIIIK